MFLKIYNTLDCYKFPLCIGNNRIISIPCIFAVNEYCLYKKYNLGILYFSANADLNTSETYLNKN